MYKYKINLGIIIAPCLERQSKDWRFFCFKSTERKNIMENNIDIKKVAELNDSLRKTFTGGRVTITDGVDALSDDDREQLFNLVKNFDTFTEDNDPYGEHDFGAINFKGEVYFWKIDYYDVDYLYLSPDISDENVTNRVLTIMRGDEY